MKKYFLLLLIVFLFNCLTVSAQTNASWFWATQLITQFNGKGGEGAPVAIDKNGNSYLTGWTNNSPDMDAYVTKIDTGGHVLWASQSHGTAKLPHIVSRCVTTDTFDNVYITGFFLDTVLFGSFQLQTGNGAPGMFLVKYDKNGNVIWATQSILSSPSYACWGEGVSTDNTGNIYVTGPFQNTVSFDATTLDAAYKSPYNINSFYIVKYDQNGNVIWAKQPARMSSLLSYPEIGPSACTTDKFSNTYITGSFYDTLVLGTTTLVNGNSLGSTFIAKYDSNGNVLWGKATIGANLGVLGKTIATDNYNVYLTGGYSNSFALGNIHLASSHGSAVNFFIVKLDSGGNTIWGKSSTTGQNTDWEGYAVAVDTQNHVYLSAGDNYPLNDTIHYGGYTFTAAIHVPRQDGNSLVLKLDTSGNLLCGTIVGCAGDDENGLAVSPSGTYIYFGGDVEIPIRLGPDSLFYYNNNEETLFMARWKPCTNCALAPAVIPQSPSYCVGQGVKLTASGATTYTWSPSTGLSATTGSSVIANPSSTTVYTITASGAGDCLATITDVVTVFPAPSINYSYSTNGYTVTFTSDSATGGVTNYTWDFGDSSAPAHGTRAVHTYNKAGTYYSCLTVYNNSNCYFTTCQYVDLTKTGVHNISGETSFQLYPNPAGNKLLVSGYSLLVNSMEITNLLGQTLITQIPSPNSKQTVIDISSLSSGIYLLVIKSNDGVVVRKFVKE